MFTDSHCHLYHEYYEDLDFIIKESISNKVNRFINDGCDRESNEEVLKLVNIYDNMYGTLGIHPENVEDYKDEDLNFIEDNLNNPKIVAIGEIGLDYHYGKENKDEQIKLLELQLKMAEEHDMPVVIHSREATLDTLNTLKKYKVKGVIHSFSGSNETAREYLKLGYLLGVNGVITFKNSNIKEVIREIPLESLILETDSPYLTPEPFRGHQNNPSHIIDIAKFVANLKDVSLEELSNITNKNLENMFKRIK